MPKVNKRKRSDKSDEINLNLTHPRMWQGRQPYDKADQFMWWRIGRMPYEKEYRQHWLYVVLVGLVFLIVLGIL